MSSGPERSHKGLAIIMVVRLSLVVCVAAVMAVVGYQLMIKAPAEWGRLDAQSFYFVWPSIWLWLALAFVLRRQNYTTAIGWGVLSPIIGSLMVAGPFGPFVALAMWYATFPVGIITGVLVKLCMSSSLKSRRSRHIWLDVFLHAK
jgi:hypothetical protein